MAQRRASSPFAAEVSVPVCPRSAVAVAVALALAWLAAACGSPAPAVAAPEADAALAADVTDGADAVQDAGQDAATKGFAAAAKLFDPHGIHVVAIELPLPDWTALLADAQDPVRVRDWHAAKVHIDGQPYDQVAVRNFGEGSQQANPKKPNVRLKFDQYDPKLEGPEGQHNLRLKASGTEPTFLREPLFFELLRSLGAPAPLWSFARVTVNGEPYGLYQLFEHPDKRLFRRVLDLPPDTGPTKRANYSPLLNCVGLQCPNAGGKQGCTGLLAHYELKVGDGSDLTALVQAIEQAPDAQLQAQVDTHASFQELLAIHAVEAAASEVDGLMASGFNFELFADAQGRLHVVRTGADETFYEHYDLMQPWGPPNVVCPGRTDRFYSRVLAIPALKDQLVQKWKALRCGKMQYKAVEAWVEALRGPILAELALDPKTLVSVADASGAMDELEAWVTDRNAALKQVVGACAP